MLAGLAEKNEPDELAYEPVRLSREEGANSVGAEGGSGA